MTRNRNKRTTIWKKKISVDVRWIHQTQDHVTQQTSKILDIKAIKKGEKNVELTIKMGKKEANKEKEKKKGFRKFPTNLVSCGKFYFSTIIF